MFLRDLEGVRKIGADERLDLAEDLLGVVDGNLARFLRRFFRQTDDGLDHRLHLPVAEHHRAEHFRLGEFLRLGFHHQHRSSGTGHHEVELRIRHRIERGIEDVGALDEADARRCDRSHEGNARERQCRGGGHQPQDVGVVLEIVAEDGDDHLGFVLVAVGEQGADRPVDQPRGQRLAFGGAAFALEVAAGNLARGEILLLVIHGEREKILSRLGGVCADDGRQHDGFSIGGKNGAVGLPGDLARFKDQRAPAPVDFLAYCLEHFRIHFPSFPRGRIASRRFLSIPQEVMRRRMRTIRTRTRNFSVTSAFSASVPAARSALRNASRRRP